MRHRYETVTAVEEGVDTLPKTTPFWIGPSPLNNIRCDRDRGVLPTQGSSCIFCCALLRGRSITSDEGIGGALTAETARDLPFIKRDIRTPKTVTGIFDRHPNPSSV